MKTKLVFFILIVVLSNFKMKSQGYDNLWVHGFLSGYPNFGGTKMNYINKTLDTSFFDKKVNFRLTVGVICNKQGDLEFYSNGITVANAQNDTMPNGDSLGTSALMIKLYQDGLMYIQGMLVIPFPIDTTKYYLFHEGGDSTNLFGGGYFPTSLLYSVVDMTLDNNKGDVTLKNQIIITDTLGGAINAVKHGNGRDWWVFNFRYNSNTIYGLLITPNGIQGPYTQNFGDSIIGAVGQGCFSPDGSQFARYNKYFPYNDLDVYDFDRCTGLFSNWRNVKINDSTSAGGVAFSPNGIYIYVSSLTKVYQFCTDSLNLANSMDTVAIYDGFVDPITPLPTTFFLAHLAPDAKIYFNCGYSVTYMHVINNPDTVAKFCGMVQHGIKVPTFNAWTMPNLPNYHLGPKYGSVCDSLSTDLTPNPSPFGEGNSLRINPNPSAGNFYVNYTLPPNTNGVLHIYDLVGNEVMQKNVYWYFGYLQIDATSLQNGMYFASLEIGGRHWAGGKIVISK